MPFASDAALTGDPSPAALAGEVRNLAARAAAAAGELARPSALTGHPADALEIAERLRRAAGLLGGLTAIRD